MSEEVTSQPHIFRMPKARLRPGEVSVQPFIHRSGRVELSIYATDDTGHIRAADSVKLSDEDARRFIELFKELEDRI